MTKLRLRESKRTSQVCKTGWRQKQDSNPGLPYDQPGALQFPDSGPDTVILMHRIKRFIPLSLERHPVASCGTNTSVLVLMTKEAHMDIK